MEKADEMEGGSVILGEQNIVHDGETFIQDQLSTVDSKNDEDQASNCKEVEWNDDGDGGQGNYSEVENDSLDSSVRLSLKHIKKKKIRIADVEDDDDRSESCKSDNIRFSQTSSIEPQGQPELLQFS